MRILLATDGSTQSLRAQRWLASHLADFVPRPEVHLFHAHPPLPYPGAAAVVGRKAVEDYQRDSAREALAPAAAALREAGVAFESGWSVGEPAAEIAGYVRDHAIDLVVLGARGHGAVLNLALGSVATKCIAILDVPVLVVPGTRGEGPA